MKAEQKAELAEFDENIPWDEREAEQKRDEEDEVSRVEIELAMLDKEVRSCQKLVEVEYKEKLNLPWFVFKKFF